MRNIWQELITWKDAAYRLPLLVRGARQIGKSYIIKKFGQNAFTHYIEINFELQPEYKTLFNEIDPKKILQKLSLKIGTPIIPGETLIFLDEIQDCPNAIMALRYFKEHMPELHIIGAGSLLDFALKKENFRMPVGRVEYRYMYPLSFKEFLFMMGKERYYHFLQAVTLKEGIDTAIHDELNKLFQHYLIIGGMPEVVAQFSQTLDFALCQRIQSNLMNTYRNDFGKYAKQSQHPYLEEIFSKSPGLIGKIFKYTHINSDVRSRELKPALTLLINANILTPVYHTAASGLPLLSTVNYKRFKINFLDVGLSVNASGLTSELLLQQDFFSLNRGAIMEQAVGQELLAYGDAIKPGELFFWTQEKSVSKAEVDYIVQVDDKIIPVEVKAGNTGRLKSLRIFIEKNKSPIGVRISQHPLALEKEILSIPVYMLSEFKRLIKETTT